MPVIQALPRIGRDDRGPAADGRLGDDAPVEGRAEHGGVRHRVADVHRAARVQHRHAGAEACAGGRAVEPAGRDDDGVLRDRADALPGLRDLDDAHARDPGVLRVRARKLLARRRADPLAGEREVARLGRLEREAERVRVGDRVPHAAERDVDGERAETVDLERRVEPVGEAGDVRQLDALAAAVAARRAHLDDARGRLEPQRRLRLAHLHHAGLEQHGGDADRVRAGHRRVLGGLHDDEAGVAVRLRRRHDQVRVHGDAAARLAQEQPAQRVVGAQRLHPLEHRFAGRREHAADDDVADLAAGVAADDRERAAGAHHGRR